MILITLSIYPFTFCESEPSHGHQSVSRFQNSATASTDYKGALEQKECLGSSYAPRTQNKRCNRRRVHSRLVLAVSSGSVVWIALPSCFFKVSSLNERKNIKPHHYKVMTQQGLEQPTEHKVKQRPVLFCFD